MWMTQSSQETEYENGEAAVQVHHLDDLALGSEDAIQLG